MKKNLILLPLITLLTLALLPAAAQAFTLQYEGNGQTSGLPPASQESETTVVVAASTMCKNGSIFGGWNTSEDGSGAEYEPGDTFAPINSSPTQTLYATWTDSPATTCPAANVSVEIIGATGAQASVVSTPAGIDCPGAACLAEFPAASNVTLNAEPDTAAGFVFLGWGGACSGTTPECVISSLSDAANVEAIFSERPTFSLAIDKDGNGWGTVTGRVEGQETDILDCGVLCQSDVAEGSTVVLQATPNESSTLDSWSEESCTGNTCSVTVSGNKVVKATFSALPPSERVSVKKARQNASRKALRQTLAQVSCLSGNCQIKSAKARALSSSSKRDIGSVWSGDSFAAPNKQSIAVNIPRAVAQNKRYKFIALTVVVEAGTERVYKTLRFALR